MTTWYTYLGMPTLNACSAGRCAVTSHLPRRARITRPLVPALTLLLKGFINIGFGWNCRYIGPCVIHRGSDDKKLYKSWWRLSTKARSGRRPVHHQVLANDGSQTLRARDCSTTLFDDMTQAPSLVDFMAPFGLEATGIIANIL